jgi:hypothetical protein
MNNMGMGRTADGMCFGCYFPFLFLDIHVSAERRILAMTHFLAVVLIPPGIEDIPAQVAQLIAPYYREREVEPYRSYFSDESVKAWAEKYGTGTNLQALLERMRQTRHMWGDTYLDEKGLYYITTFNPRGMWDYWFYSGGEDMLGEQAWTECLERQGDGHECNSCPVVDLPPDFCPAALVTPDGIWYDLIDYGWHLVDGDTPANRVALATWRAQAREILDKHMSCLAVGIHCHG